MPLLADPSHIAGSRELIFEVSQKAMDLGYDGLMIETHPYPDQALSDAQQQITPDALKALLEQLRISNHSSTNTFFINQLEELRLKIDSLDQELVDTLSARMNLVNLIGAYKKDNNVTVFQLERWQEIMQTRSDWGNKQKLSKDFITEIFKAIHDESIRLQTDVITKEPSPTNNAS